MRNEIQAFCNLIKVDYSMILYNHSFVCKDSNKREYSQFPFCCKLSADIVTSFLQMIYGDDFQYMCTTSGNVIHGWTSYDSNNEHFIVDFTYFQFEIKDKERELWKNRKIKKNEIIQFLQQYNPVKDCSDFDAGIYKNITIPENQKCIGRRDKYKVELTKDSFLNYVEAVIDDVYENTQYCISPF